MNFPSANLDLLRSLAVSFVVMSHLLLDKGLVKPWGYDTQILGTLGVLIFFVHTCLVLMLSLERQADSDGQAPTTLSFLVARAFRIYPLSVVAVVLLSSIELMQLGAGPDLGTFLSNLFLIQNITGSPSVTPVLWSLPFEFQMYFFLPALYLWTQHSGRRGAGRIVLLWGACVALVIAFWRLGVDYNLIRFFPCFLPGVLAFCQRRSPRTWSPGVLFAYVGAMVVLYPSLVGCGINATFLSWLICLGLGLLIPRCREIRSAFLGTAGSVIARYSYGIYLIHDPIRHVAFYTLAGLSPLASWMVFFGAVGGLSWLAYHCIEKPGIELGKTLANRFKVYRLQAGQNP